MDGVFNSIMTFVVSFSMFCICNFHSLFLIYLVFNSNSLSFTIDFFFDTVSHDSHTAQQEEDGLIPGIKTQLIEQAFGKNSTQL